jgi:hypothetical protein
LTDPPPTGAIDRSSTANWSLTATCAERQVRSNRRRILMLTELLVHIEIVEHNDKSWSDSTSRD